MLESSMLIRSYLRCRSEEHTSELQSLAYLVCRLLLEKKKVMSIDVRIPAVAQVIGTVGILAHSAQPASVSVLSGGRHALVINRDVSDFAAATLHTKQL